MTPTKAFAQVRLFVNEYFCGDDIAKGHEHLHEVLVTKLLRQVVDEQVGSVGTCQTQQRSRSVLTWHSMDLSQHSKGQGQCQFLHSAVSSPQDCSKCFTLYFPGRPAQLNTISTALAINQPYCN